MIKRLGKDSDRRVAAELGIGHRTVFMKRRLLGIAAYAPKGNLPAQGFRWTPARIALLGTDSDRRIAKRLGTSPGSVTFKRRVLRIPSFRPRPKRIRWTREMISLLGIVNDRDFARRFGITQDAVKQKRDELRIEPLRGWKPYARTASIAKLLRRPNYELKDLGLTKSLIQKLRREFGIPAPESSRSRRWTPKNLARLGKETDGAIAKRLGVTPGAVQHKRASLGIAPFVRKHQWSKKEVALLGTASDEVLARKIGISKSAVRAMRKRLGIKAVTARHQWRPEEIARLGTDSDSAIARELGLSLQQVAGLLAR